MEPVAQKVHPSERDGFLFQSQCFDLKLFCQPIAQRFRQIGHFIKGICVMKMDPFV
jgi:hypothetical protein